METQKYIKNQISFYKQQVETYSKQKDTFSDELAKEVLHGQLSLMNTIPMQLEAVLSKLQQEQKHLLYIDDAVYTKQQLIDDLIRNGCKDAAETVKKQGLPHKVFSNSYQVGDFFEDFEPEKNEANHFVCVEASTTYKKALSFVWLIKK